MECGSDGVLSDQHSTTPSLRSVLRLAALDLDLVGVRVELRAEAEGLALSNAVNLGPLELRFRGAGQLVGRRPLLQFSFQQLQVSLGGRLLIQRELSAPAARRLPFFALIARDPSGWLAARGRGGGLAVWTLAAAG